MSKPPGPRVQHKVAFEVTSSCWPWAVPGASGTLVRTGRGNDRATVTAYLGGTLRLALLDVGFPAVAEAHASDDVIALCTMLRTPAQGTWDGVALAPGQTFVYPPGETHHVNNPSGLLFAMCVIPWAPWFRDMRLW